MYVAAGSLKLPAGVWTFDDQRSTGVAVSGRHHPEWMDKISLQNITILAPLFPFYSFLLAY
jgi:hypothetical protein